MAEKQEEQIQTAVRLPKSLLKRLDKLAKSESTNLRTVTRSHMHRFALEEGLDKIEKAKKR